MKEVDPNELFLSRVKNLLPTYVSNRARLLAAEAILDFEDEPRAEDRNYLLARWFDAALSERT